MIVRWLKTSVKQQLLSRDALISRPVGQFDATQPKLLKLRNRGFQVKLAIDGGAAEGGWAQMLKTVWSQAQVICVEPREECASSIMALSKSMPGIHLAQTLLGPDTGTITLNTHGTQSSALANHDGKSFGQTRQVPMTTLDLLAGKMNLGWPDLIKLDLQGYELHALSGAAQCMQHAQAVILEVSFIPLMKDMPLIGEVIPFMKERGFQAYDILAMWHRPLDGALAQGDFLFMRQGHPLLKDHRWSVDASW